MNPSENPENKKKRPLSLYALNQKIGINLRNAFPGTYWITAEISEMSVNSSGHCYMEIVEKAEGEDTIIARNRAVIWAYTFRMLKPFFETAAGISLAPGIRVMALVEITFHEVYGLSLIVQDIEPGFTVGEMALRKQEVIRQLKEEGIFDMNRRAPLPLVPQRIAVISSEKAAGFQDFITHLSTNEYHFAFSWTLFPAIMQGKESEPTIIAALEKINTLTEQFDLVVLIRGGGAQADLSAFNQYRMAAHLAQFPLPVITGIGHEKDESVCDLVARINLKTPTAVAQFLIDRMSAFEETLIHTFAEIREYAVAVVDQHKIILQRKASTFHTNLMEKIHHNLVFLKQYPYRYRSACNHTYLSEQQVRNTITNHLEKAVSVCTGKQTTTLRALQTALKYKAFASLDRCRDKMEIRQNLLKNLDPVTPLKRGYTITRKGNQIIRNARQLKPGDIITTQFEKDSSNSKIV